MISRDWRCLNPACGAVFHSNERNPECSQCGNVRVTWVPGGGHVMSKAPGIDRTVRQLADNYGMSDVNSPSPSRLNRAMPQAARAASGPAVQFAPGFAAPIDMKTGAITCEPSQVALPVLPGKVTYREPSAKNH